MAAVLLEEPPRSPAESWGNPRSSARVGERSLGVSTVSRQAESEPPWTWEALPGEVGAGGLGGQAALWDRMF